MTITIDLPENTLAALRADAKVIGEPLETLAAAHVAAAYLLPPIPHVADDDAQTLAALIAEGETDFAAGRFKTRSAGDGTQPPT